MKKSSILIASAIMCLAVIVGIVGVTAAWFGNTLKLSDTVVISSTQPSGNATIVADSVSNSTATGAKLTPAKIKPGLMLNDFKGENGYNQLPVYGDDALPYLDDGTAQNSDKPLMSLATDVEVSFDFKYTGAGEGGNITQAISIELTSVTLQNPRRTVTAPDGEETIVFDTTLPNYRDEFVAAMSINTTDDFVNNNYSETLAPMTESNPQGQHQEGHILNFIIVSGPDYTLTVVLYFAKIDEETSPELLDRQLFFNFELQLG